MLTFLTSFLGGSVVRAVWGEISAYLSHKRDHLGQVELLKLQGQIDAERRASEAHAMLVSGENARELIRVRSVAEIELESAKAFTASQAVLRETEHAGWSGHWNRIIRPAGATLSLLMIGFSEFDVITLSATAWELSGSVLGYYYADRTLFKNINKSSK